VLRLLAAQGFLLVHRATACDVGMSDVKVCRVVQDRREVGAVPSITNHSIVAV
jgi:hypothetical protein